MQLHQLVPFEEVGSNSSSSKLPKTGGSLFNPKQPRSVRVQQHSTSFDRSKSWSIQKWKISNFTDCCPVSCEKSVGTASSTVVSTRRSRSHRTLTPNRNSSQQSKELDESPTAVVDASSGGGENSMKQASASSILMNLQLGKLIRGVGVFTSDNDPVSSQHQGDTCSESSDSPLAFQSRKQLHCETGGGLERVPESTDSFITTDSSQPQQSHQGEKPLQTSVTTKKSTESPLLLDLKNESAAGPILEVHSPSPTNDVLNHKIRSQSAIRMPSSRVDIARAVNFNSTSSKLSKPSSLSIRSKSLGSSNQSSIVTADLTPEQPKDKLHLNSSKGPVDVDSVLDDEFDDLECRLQAWKHLGKMGSSENPSDSNQYQRNNIQLTDVPDTRNKQPELYQTRKSPSALSLSNLAKPSLYRNHSTCSNLSINSNMSRDTGPVDVDSVNDVYPDDLTVVEIIPGPNTETNKTLSSTEPDRPTLVRRHTTISSSSSVASNNRDRAESIEITYEEYGGLSFDDGDEFVLDEVEISRGLAGYEIGFEPETIWELREMTEQSIKKTRSRNFLTLCQIPSAIMEEGTDGGGDEEEDNNVDVKRRRNRRKDQEQLDAAPTKLKPTVGYV